MCYNTTMENQSRMRSIKSGYFKLPNKIFKLNLDPISIGIYSLFLSMPESFNPTPKWTCDTLGIHRNTYFKKIIELLDSHTIELVSKGYSFSGVSQTALYRFAAPSTWVPLTRRSKKTRKDKGTKKGKTKLSVSNSSTDVSNKTPDIID